MEEDVNDEKLLGTDLKVLYREVGGAARTLVGRVLDSGDWVIVERPGGRIFVSKRSVIWIRPVGMGGSQEEIRRESGQ
ncbi:MAG TPA: hypothetical protein VEY12_05700 [Thermoplasmata archaeon]|nr:hypothetical protein [Thermoplasmata archaeon]